MSQRNIVEIFYLKYNKYYVYIVFKREEERD